MTHAVSDVLHVEWGVYGNILRCAKGKKSNELDFQLADKVKETVVWSVRDFRHRLGFKTTQTGSDRMQHVL